MSEAEGGREQAQAAAQGERDQLQAALHQLVRLVASRSVFARQAEAAGIELPQQGLQVLRALHGAPARPVSEVARTAQMDVGAVSRSLRGLEEAGLVARRSSSANGSVVLVEATAAGEELAQRFRRVANRQLRDALADWSAEDREQLGSLLARLVDDLQRTPIRQA